ncbi:hypothetical protein NITLEN_10471 [Nitrospira lenta]|uniref:Uncharacterized protein n=1 Tax=Nitrospira lenta TaxID=1436998 RepID=A0A330L0W2_9BACT|nr:hypothetical protein NITLEN_10471 [Nitrospira lenta]
MSDAKPTDPAPSSTGNIPEACVSILVRLSKSSAPTRQSELTLGCALIRRRESCGCFIRFLVSVSERLHGVHFVTDGRVTVVGRMAGSMGASAPSMTLLLAWLRGGLCERIVVSVAIDHQNDSDAKTRRL